MSTLYTVHRKARRVGGLPWDRVINTQDGCELARGWLGFEHGSSGVVASALTCFSRRPSSPAPYQLTFIEKDF